ncbi:unnamed protein product [Adineta steineri]|uniref:Uncharacterized protein n=1 Tax=Adineta steineri TaxID=433720 RepID=A0A816BY85_9BILA|nr:unnamed protein product [Adineta steineri]CAF1616606.1 unnamed protein product [Adineta steineri]
MKLKTNSDDEYTRTHYVQQTSSFITKKSSPDHVFIFGIYLSANNLFKFSVKIFSFLTTQHIHYYPELCLREYAKEHYGFSYIPNINKHIISASNDQIINLWIIKKQATKGKFIHPLRNFSARQSVVKDVTCHLFHETFFGSISDDFKLMIWDTRSSNYTKPSHIVDTHSAEINYLLFNSFSEYILATDSADKICFRIGALWDLRYLKLKLHTFESHKDEIFHVK